MDSFGEERLLRVFNPRRDLLVASFALHNLSLSTISTILPRELVTERFDDIESSSNQKLQGQNSNHNPTKTNERFRLERILSGGFRGGFRGLTFSSVHSFDATQTNIRDAIAVFKLQLDATSRMIAFSRRRAKKLSKSILGFRASNSIRTKPKVIS